MAKRKLILAAQIQIATKYCYDQHLIPESKHRDVEPVGIPPTLNPLGHIVCLLESSVSFTKSVLQLFNCYRRKVLVPIIEQVNDEYPPLP